METNTHTTSEDRVIILSHWSEIIKCLIDEGKEDSSKDLLFAIWRYVYCGKSPEFNDFELKMIWMSLLPILDKQKRAIRRTVAARENGKRSRGRPKKIENGEES